MFFIHRAMSINSNRMLNYPFFFFFCVVDKVKPDMTLKKKYILIISDKTVLLHYFY